MPNSLSATGITTATKAELSAQMIAAFQVIFGPDINLDSDTPDGQLMNIFIQGALDYGDLVVQVFNSMDPDNAIGVVLDQRVAYNGIQRQAGTYSQTNITLVTSQSLNLYGLDQDIQDVYTVADNAGNKWELITSQLGVSPGTHVYSFRAQQPGQKLTIPNTITVPVTIVLGVTSINNPTVYSQLGINEESDAQLKIRRSKSVSLQTQGYFQGLRAALENINGITSTSIYENTTSGTDADGIPGHSIWVIVAGTPAVPLSVAYNAATVYKYGDIASASGVNYFSIQSGNVGNSTGNTAYWRIYNPVAQAIYAYRNAGAGMYNSGGPGAQQYTVVQPDGSPFTVYWDTVVPQDLYIKFTTSSLNGVNPPNIALIKNYLVANYIPGVYEDVDINGLSTAIQQVDPNTLVTNAGFSTSAAGTYTNALFPSTKNQQFVVSEANIIVLPIIMACPGGTQTIVGGTVTGTTISVANGGTVQFTPLGGYGTFPGTMVFSVFSGPGSVNSSSGLYTASGGAGTAVVRVTDTLGNIASATVTVT